MKRALILSVLMATMFRAFAQETRSEQTNPPLTKDDYLQKNKRQKTAAIVLVSGGGAFVIIGAAIAASTVSYTIDLWGTGQPAQDTNSEETLSSVLAITGLVAIVASIPLFVSAHKNKKRALSMSFKNELAPALQRSMVIYKSVPSLNLQLRL